MTRTLDTSFIEDRRARVPFAVIGVVLLVSAVMIVGYLETRPEPEADVDAALATDRTDAATQSVVSDAVIDATDRAASAPVTAPAEDGAFEGVLGDPDSYDEDEVFESYVSLLVYQRVQERLEQAGQEVGQDTETRVSLPSVDPDGSGDAIEPGEAIDRVEFEPGYNTSDLDTGMLRVTIEDVETTVHEDGDRIAPTRTDDVTVTVAVPLFELHDTTSEYADALQTDFWDGGAYEGLGQYLAARLYPIAYARMGVNYARSTRSSGLVFDEVLPNNQTEVFTNHAIFAIQRDTFGTQDPLADRTMRGAFACWVAREGEELMGETSSDIDASDICEGLEYIYGDASGSLPDAPQLHELATDRLEQQESLNEEEEIEWTLTADLAEYWFTGVDVPDDWGLGDYITSQHDDGEFETPDTIDGIPEEFEYQIDDVVQRIYSAEVTAQTTDTPGDPSLPDPTPADWPPGDDWEEQDSRVEVSTDEPPEVTLTPVSGESGNEQDLYTVEATLTNEYVAVEEWENTSSGEERTHRSDPRTHTFSTEIELSARHSPGAQVPHLTHDLQNAYESGGSSPLSGTAANFDEVPDSSLEEVFGVGSSSFESDLESRISDAQDIHDGEEFTDALGEYEEGTAMLEGSEVTSTDVDRIESWVEDDLVEEIHGDAVGEGPTEVPRIEFATGNPFGQMRQEVDDAHDDIVWDGNRPDTMENAPALLEAEVRHQFHGIMTQYIDPIAQYHQEHQQDFEEDLEIEELDEGMEFAQDAMNGDIDANGGSLETPELVDDIDYEVRGAPTYLSLDVVTRDTVPAVRPDDTPPLELEDTNHVPMTTRYDNRAQWPGIPLLPLGYTWVASISSWDVEVGGEYARFEVTATTGDPSTPSSTTYVREDADIPLGIGDTEDVIGEVEEIEFDTSLEIIGLMPGGQPGVGDAGGAPVCPETWDHTGPDFEIPDDQSGSCHSDVDRMP